MEVGGDCVALRSVDCSRRSPTISTLSPPSLHPLSTLSSPPLHPLSTLSLPSLHPLLHSPSNLFSTLFSTPPFLSTTPVFFRSPLLVPHHCQCTPKSWSLDHLEEGDVLVDPPHASLPIALGLVHVDDAVFDTDAVHKVESVDHDVILVTVRGVLLLLCDTERLVLETICVDIVTDNASRVPSPPEVPGRATRLRARPDGARTDLFAFRDSRDAFLISLYLPHRPLVLDLGPVRTADGVFRDDRILVEVVVFLLHGSILGNNGRRRSRMAGYTAAQHAEFITHRRRWNGDGGDTGLPPSCGRLGHVDFGSALRGGAVA